MSKISINGSEHYYEQAGQGLPLVFVHGAFADSRIWEPQWKHFANNYFLVRYDLRGHGQTGPADLRRYTMDTFADDLCSLLDALKINTPITLCGLSWGGSIAQLFAIRHPDQLKGLILASSAIAIDLTIVDKLLCNILLPKWLMFASIRKFSADKFIRFSLWLAPFLYGKRFLSQDVAVRTYLEQCMLQMNGDEYLKIWEAIYGFHVFPLRKISCPTLVINGELESRNTYRHTQEILNQVPRVEAKVIPGVHHVLNLEAPGAFNRLVEEFIRQSA